MQQLHRAEQQAVKPLQELEQRQVTQSKQQGPAEEQWAQQPSSAAATFEQQLQPVEHGQQVSAQQPTLAKGTPAPQHTPPRQLQLALPQQVCYELSMLEASLRSPDPFCARSFITNDATVSPARKKPKALSVDVQQSMAQGEVSNGAIIHPARSVQLVALDIQLCHSHKQQQKPSMRRFRGSAAMQPAAHSVVTCAGTLLLQEEQGLVTPGGTQQAGRQPPVSSAGLATGTMAAMLAAEAAR
jgi:hypothetical protein